MSFEVPIPSLRRAAHASRSAADQAAQLDLAAALHDAGAGLPGAEAASELTAVATQWSARISRWVADARAYAGQVDASATSYERSDAAAAAAFPGRH